MATDPQHRLPYENLSFRRAKDARDIPNSQTLGRYGLSLPSGFNSGHQIALLLDRHLLPYSDMKTFDQLPIPFRCVAVDMVSRQRHVFDSGSLAQALRASMSIPGFFTPVINGNHIYVDDGLLDNLPVDAGRQMGADLVLAVHLQKKLISPNDNLNSFSVLTNAINVMVAVNELQSMQRADLL